MWARSGGTGDSPGCHGLGGTDRQGDGSGHVTERQQVEELEQHERAILEASAQAIISVGPGGASAERMAGDELSLLRSAD